MITVANRIFLKPEFHQEFEQRFKNRIEHGSLHQQPGFIRFQIHKPVSETAPYVVHTTWQDKSSFDAWVGSEDFANAHRNPLPEEAFAQKGSMEIHEVTLEKLSDN